MSLREPPEAIDYVSLRSVNLHGSRHTVGTQEVKGLQQLFLTHYSVSPLPMERSVETKECWSSEVLPEEMEFREVE